MRLRVFNFSEVYGGQEVYLWTLLNRLSTRGSIRCLTFAGGPPSLARTLYSGIVPNDSSAQGRTCEAWLINGNRALYREAWRRRGREVRIYVQHSSIDDLQDGVLKQVIRRVLLLLLLKKIDAVIRVSEACLPDGYAPGKVFTVPNGIDLARFPCRARWRSGPGQAPLRLLMVGALTANKNQRLGIEALAALPNAELTLVGDGRERGALEALARSLGVSERVHWMGQQADPAPFYREADICLLLSQHEAAPFVLLESMASGTPVVAVRVGGVPEVVIDGQNGILLTDTRATTLVTVLQGLAQEPERLSELGRAARRHIESRYTVDHMVHGFLEVVDEALRRRRVGMPS